MASPQIANSLYSEIKTRIERNKQKVKELDAERETLEELLRCAEKRVQDANATVEASPSMPHPTDNF